MLERFLDAELGRHRLPASALALVGFSQGTMMALHVGLRRTTAPAAIVGYSGLLVLPPDVDAEAAHAALTAVHGIGPWTADIYLLACLGHTDAWPAGDLALQEAARLAFGLKARPTAKEMMPLAEPWRPWRAVAARVLWTYYRTVKGREGAPILPKKSIKPKGKKNGR